MQLASPKQKAVLDFIERFQAEKGYFPSRREIALGLGLSSVATVQQHVEALVQKGLLEHRSGEARGLQPVDRGEFGSARMLSLEGRVAAGFPIESVKTGEKISVPESLLGRGEFYVLQVSGHSMIEDGILEGDYVVIRKTHQAKNGQTVVALIDSEATIKKFWQKSAQVELHPANPAYPVIQVDPSRRFEIMGVLQTVIRRYG